MGADGISEGFAKSIELHGLKFNRLIGIILSILNIIKILIIQ
jgi:hypothetical protein